MWLLIAALPISLYISWYDMRTMKIPNVAVGALLIGFAVLGPFAFGFDQYLWQWSHFAIVLLIGFILNAIGIFGAGDAKFSAAAAPYILFADLEPLAWAFVGCIIACYFVHRLVKHTPLRRLVPDWKSWTSGKRFPMGFPLGMTLIAYLVTAATQATV